MSAALPLSQPDARPPRKPIPPIAPTPPRHPGRPRKPLEATLCVVIQTRMLPHEVDALYRIALHRDMSLSDLVREQLAPLLA